MPGITKYDQPADAQFINTYVPLPFNELMQMRQYNDQQEARLHESAGELPKLIGTVMAAPIDEPDWNTYVQGKYLKPSEELYQQYYSKKGSSPEIAGKMRNLAYQFANDPYVKTVLQGRKEYETNLTLKEKYAGKLGPHGESLLKAQEESLKPIDFSTGKRPSGPQSLILDYSPYQDPRTVFDKRIAAFTPKVRGVDGQAPHLDPETGQIISTSWESKKLLGENLIRGFEFRPGDLSFTRDKDNLYGRVKLNNYTTMNDYIDRNSKALGDETINSLIDSATDVASRRANKDGTAAEKETWERIRDTSFKEQLEDTLTASANSMIKDEWKSGTELKSAGRSGSGSGEKVGDVYGLATQEVTDVSGDLAGIEKRFNVKDSKGNKYSTKEAGALSAIYYGPITELAQQGSRGTSREQWKKVENNWKTLVKAGVTSGNVKKYDDLFKPDGSYKSEEARRFVTGLVGNTALALPSITQSYEKGVETAIKDYSIMSDVLKKLNYTDSEILQTIGNAEVEQSKSIKAHITPNNQATGKEALTNIKRLSTGSSYFKTDKVGNRTDEKAVGAEEGVTSDNPKVSENIVIAPYTKEGSKILREVKLKDGTINTYEVPASYSTSAKANLKLMTLVNNAMLGMSDKTLQGGKVDKQGNNVYYTVKSTTPTIVNLNGEWRSGNFGVIVKFTPGENKKLERTLALIDEEGKSLGVYTPEELNYVLSQGVMYELSDKTRKTKKDYQEAEDNEE